jgi:hypothetical protein
MLTLKRCAIIKAITKKIRWKGHVASRDIRSTYRIFVVQPQGKKILGNVWRRCKGYINVDLREM